MKSIEEERRAVTNEVFKKLVYITSGTGISKEELVELVDLINETSKKAVNAKLEEMKTNFHETMYDPDDNGDMLHNSFTETTDLKPYWESYLDSLKQ